MNLLRLKNLILIGLIVSLISVALVKAQEEKTAEPEAAGEGGELDTTNEAAAEEGAVSEEASDGGASENPEAATDNETEAAADEEAAATTEAPAAEEGGDEAASSPAEGEGEAVETTAAPVTDEEAATSEAAGEDASSDAAEATEAPAGEDSSAADDAATEGAEESTAAEEEASTAAEDEAVAGETSPSVDEEPKSTDDGVEVSDGQKDLQTEAASESEDETTEGEIGSTDGASSSEAESTDADGGDEATTEVAAETTTAAVSEETTAAVTEESDASEEPKDETEGATDESTEGGESSPTDEANGDAASTTAAEDDAVDETHEDDANASQNAEELTTAAPEGTDDHSDHSEDGGESTEGGETSDPESTLMPSTDEEGSGEVDGESTLEGGEGTTGEDVPVTNDDNTDGSTETDVPATTTEPISDKLVLILSPNKEVVTIAEGESLEIKCTARGPQADLQTVFYKDQQPLLQSETGTVVLKIESAKKSDQGQYLCYGFPPDRSSYEAKAITVKVGSGSSNDDNDRQDPASPDRNHKKASVNANIELECDLSRDNTELRWSKVYGPMSDYTRPFNGKLYIYYLKPSDSGEYVCTATDGRTARVRLTVYEGEPPRDGDDDNTEGQGAYAIRVNLDRSSLSLRAGISGEISCTGMTNGPELEIEWYNQRGQRIQSNRRFEIKTSTTNERPLTKVSTLSVNNFEPSVDTGSYECRGRVGRQREVVSFEIRSDDADSNAGEPPIQTPACDILEATCRNGQCIPRSGLCDGKVDCTDGSDEINCNGVDRVTGCEPNEKACKNGKCIQKIWFCDGENDCEDNSDENQCPVPRPGEICQSNEFMCKSRQQCVLKGFVCDGEYDCVDQSDEIGCEQPRIVRGPVRNITVSLGGTIRIECEAAGFPSPFINWRLNWGHVCEEPRCFSSNENGVGVLTITDARLTDSGAYSCEALNSKGRVFAIPDAIATVVDNNKGPVCECYNHALSCTRDRVCVNCQHFTTGKNCERCIDGYEGNPRRGTPNDCQPIRPVRPDPQPQPPSPTQQCDPRGSISPRPNQPCQCKPFVTGQYCDQCLPKHFNLVRTREYKKGCMKCFCNGLNVDCRSSDLYYKPISSAFYRSDDEGWKVFVRETKEELPVQMNDNGIKYTEFADNQEKEFYFSAPAKYTGNRLASYGGNITFTIMFEGSSSSSTRKKLEFRITGSQINLYYNFPQNIYPYEEYKVVVPLYETEFKRYGDNAVVDREHMLMALSNIKQILIRAKLFDEQYAVKLIDFSIDHAEEADMPMPAHRKALAVEQCSCPPGYTGLSCQDCAKGYRKSRGGFYLGLCERESGSCFCNGHSDECDASGRCLACRDNTEGDQCERCAQDFEGDATRGTAFDCQPRKQVDIIIEVPNNNLVLRPGQNHVVYVRVTGSTNRVVWIREPDNYLPPGVTQQGNSLYIDNARPDITGKYVCFVLTPTGEVRRELEISVPSDPSSDRRPPSIYSPNPKEINVQLGDGFTLTCEAEGNPLPSIRIETPLNYRAPQLVRRPNPKATFQVSGATIDNAGEYTCIAENEYGERSVRKFLVRILSSGQAPTIKIEPKLIEAYEGSSLTINSSYAGSDPVDIKVEMLIAPNRYQIVDTFVFNRDSKKVEVRRITKDMGGQYVITATNAFGLANDYFTLLVLDAPGPRIQVAETFFRMDVGTTLRIEPRVQYNGQPYFTWSKDNGPLPSNVQTNGYVLYVPRVTKENEGVYTLTLVDSSGTAKIQVSVIVEQRAQTSTQRPGAPRRINIARDMDIELNQGESANLFCNLRSKISNPRAISTTSWFRGNRAQREKFPSNIRPNNEVLQVIKVKPSDSGEYTCTVVSSDGILNSVVVYLRVKSNEQERIPPTAKVSEPERTVRVGESLQVRCFTTGTPEPRITWLFNNYPVENYQPNVYARDGTLAIQNINENLSGTYTCRATSPDGLTAQDSTYIRVLPNEQEDQPPTWNPNNPQPDGNNNEPQNLIVQVIPKSANPLVGETARFACTVTDSNGGAYNPPNSIRFRWTKQEGGLPGGADPSEDGTLTLYNLQEQDSGIYICEVYGINIENNRAVTALTVIPNNLGIIEEPVKVEVNPKVVNILQGRDAEIECLVSGGKSPFVAWKRISEKLDAQRHIVEGTVLKIRNAQPSDRGYFECMAESGAENTARDYVRVEIESREAPQVEIYPKEDTVAVDFGGSTYMQCRVLSGIPTPTVEWRRQDGQPLSSRISITQEGTLMQIQDAGASEFGTYECVARNDEGEEKAQITVVSRGREPSDDDEEAKRLEEEARRRKEEEDRRREESEREREDGGADQPPYAIPNESYVEAQEGDSISLVCQSSRGNRDQLRYEWTNGRGSYLQAQQDGSLALNGVRRSDSGVYECIITNAFGSSRAQIEVKVNDGDRQPQRPLRVQVSPKSRSVAPGGSVEFNCQVQQSGDDTPIIRWSRANGQALSSYHSISGNTLRIQNVQESDSGRYQCTAQATDGQINFDAAYLQVSRRDSNGAFPVYIRVSEMPTESYQNLALYKYGLKVTAECVAQTSDVIDITWSKMEGVSRATYERYGNTNKMTIPALVPMDLGSYVCIATRQDGSRAQNSIKFDRYEERGNLFKFEVQGPTDPVVEAGDREDERNDQDQGEREQTPREEDVEQSESGEPVVKIIGERQVRVAEGRSATINCQVSGSPKPRVEWERHGGALPVQHSIQDNKIVLYNLKEADSGYYICNAENSLGRNRDYVYLTVEREDGGEVRPDEGRREEDDQQQQRTTTPAVPVNKPFVHIKTQSNGKLIKVGEEFQLVCIANEASSIQIARADGKNERVTVEESANDNVLTATLTIAAFQLEDATQYRCVATNEQGQVAYDTAIIEHESDESFSFQTQRQHDSQGAQSRLKIRAVGPVEAGRTVELNCNLENGDDEVHQYTWSRYPSLPKDSIVEANRLIIQRFNDEEDNGVYLCRAVRKDGSEENALKLIASNNYLLGTNPYFSFVKDEAAEKVIVKCRPTAESYYTWKAPQEQASDDSTTQIDNDELHLTRTDQSHIFTCKLNTDSEYGPIALDLEVTRELVEQALLKNLDGGEDQQQPQPQQPDGGDQSDNNSNNEASSSNEETEADSEAPSSTSGNNDEENETVNDETTAGDESWNNENESSDDVDISGSTELDESQNDADIECKPGEIC